jgi:hypothetical protein
MMKKIALCAVLILVLVPAFAMAAGPQGPGAGKSSSAGNGLQVQQMTTSETASQVQLRSCQQQGFGNSAENGNGQMLRNRTCDQDREMLQNMIRNQTRNGLESGAGGTCQGAGFWNGTSTRTDTGLLNQEDGQMNQAQNRMLEQKRIQAGLASGNGQVSPSGSADQIRDRTRDMARNQTRLQDGSCGNCPGC